MFRIRHDLLLSVRKNFFRILPRFLPWRLGTGTVLLQQFVPIRTQMCLAFSLNLPNSCILHNRCVPSQHFTRQRYRCHILQLFPMGCSYTQQLHVLCCCCLLIAHQYRYGEVPTYRTIEIRRRIINNTEIFYTDTGISFILGISSIGPPPPFSGWQSA